MFVPGLWETCVVVKLNLNLNLSSTQHQDPIEIDLTVSVSVDYDEVDRNRCVSDILNQLYMYNICYNASDYNDYH